jgi:hypothetical protein
MEPQSASSREVEAIVRRYLARVARRYTPLVVALVVLLLVVTLVPTVSPKNQAANQLGGTNQVAGGPLSGQAAAGTGATASTVAGGPATGSVAPIGSVGGTTGSSDTANGITAPLAAGAAGVTRAGIQCGPGVLQVPWSPYAPPCVSAYSGNNGGTTSFGVSKTSITAVFRRTNSAEEKAAFALVGKAAPGTDDQWLSDMRMYLGLFNKTYELYGRQLVLKDFTGQGDNLQEDQGQNLEGAQADAATAHDRGAFMDLTQSPTLALTQPYAEDLAQQHVVTVGGLALPQSWYQQHAPWEFSPLGDGTKAAQISANLVCARLSGQPAVFAGDPVYQHENRVLGLVTPDSDVYNQLGNEIVQNMQRGCGAAIAKRIHYSINVATVATQAVNVMGQLHAAGVTTVICVCDPTAEITFSSTAATQAYTPEWIVSPWLDPEARVTNQSEWSHAVSLEGTSPRKAESEAYKAFKLAAAAAGQPTAEPKEQYFGVAYYILVYAFNVLQRAGPNLNPTSFEQAAFSMPKTAVGDIGTWGGGPQAFTPNLDAHVGYWDPNAISNFDGMKGAWISCEGGAWFPFAQSTFGPRQQLHCFGR